MRVFIAAFASLVGSIVFQMSVDAGYIRHFTWAIPWLWGACAALWVAWLLMHDLLAKRWLKGLHQKLGRRIYPIRMVICLIVFLGVGLLLRSYIGPNEKKVAAAQSPTQPQVQPSPPQPTPPATPSKEKAPGQNVKVKGNDKNAGNIDQTGSEHSNAAIGNDNFQNSGDIKLIVAPCGIAQIGNKNVATVYCAPPSGVELAKFGAGIVVQIESGLSKSAVPIATGFWLNNKGYVATCLHPLAGKEGIAAAVPMPPLLGQSMTVASGSMTTGVELIDSDVDADIAILHVLASPFERSMHGMASYQKLDEQGRNVSKPEVTTEQYWVPTVAKVLAHDGDDIIKVGFIQQNGMPVVTYDFGHITRMGVDSSSGQESHRVFTSFSNKDSDCGAPIINNAKTVVGMIHGPNGAAIPSTYILKLLEKDH